MHVTTADEFGDARASTGESARVSARVSIIVPTLNEVENIDSLLGAVLAQSSPQLGLEVLVADGGSTDGTVERVKDWERRGPVRLVAAGGKRGLAGDVLAAAELSHSPVVVVMDADFSHPPESIPDLVGPIIAGESDMVVGSRYVPGGATPDWPWRRRVLSRLGGFLAWPLTDIKDPMSGFFAVRRQRLLAVDPEACGFKIGLEVMAISGDTLRVAEVPITFRDRVHGTSKIGLSQMTAYVRRLMVLAGGAISMGTATRFAAVGALGLVVDLIAFNALYAAGFNLVKAHIASFVLATVFNYILNSRWSFAESARTRAESDWKRYARFLAVCLLALFLRGGVLGTAVHAWGWTPQLAILLGIATASAVNYLGNAFFVFPSLSPRVSRIVRWRMAALGILAYVVALRLAFMGAVDLLPEEAYYWNYAQHLDIGYLDHPPMVAWMIWLGTTVFGHSEFAVRFGAAVSWVVAAFFCFQLARNLYGKTEGFIAVLLFSALPFYFAMGLLMMPDAPLTAAWAGALYFLERATLGEQSKAWLGAGVCIGLGMLSKYTIALLGPATLIFLLLDARSRQWFKSPWPYLAVAVASLLFSPVIVWNAMNDWISFAFQSTRRLHDSPEFSLHVLLGSILVLITPVGFVAAIKALAPSNRFRLALQRRVDRKYVFIAVYTLIPLSVFVAFSLFHEIKLNWTGPLWLAVIPALAHAIATERKKSFMAREPRAYRVWGATVAVTLLLYGASLHYMAIGLPGVGYSDNLRGVPVAWEEFAKAAEEIEEHVEDEAGYEPLLVGMDKYNLASEMAFYRRDHLDQLDTTAGRALFGLGSLMYDYWLPDDLLGKRPVIMVSLTPDLLSSSVVAARFEKLGPVEERIVQKTGERAGRFFYRVGYGFRHGTKAVGMSKVPNRPVAKAVAIERSPVAYLER